MSIIKLTTWNIEHLGKLLPDMQQENAERLSAIANEINEVGPDILNVVESPGNLPASSNGSNQKMGFQDNTGSRRYLEQTKSCNKTRQTRG